jgi:hypothetical protein
MCNDEKKENRAERERGRERENEEKNASAIHRKSGGYQQSFRIQRTKCENRPTSNVLAQNRSRRGGRLKARGKEIHP